MLTETGRETLATIRRLGVVRSGDLEAQGIPRGRIYRLLRQGLVERKGRGLYVASDRISPDLPAPFRGAGRVGGANPSLLSLIDAWFR